jgi:hypothetical protein
VVENCVSQCLCSLVEARPANDLSGSQALRPSRSLAFFGFPVPSIPIQLRGHLAFAGAQPNPGSQQSIPGYPKVWETVEHEEAEEPGQARRSVRLHNCSCGGQVSSVRVKRWVLPFPNESVAQPSEPQGLDETADGNILYMLLVLASAVFLGSESLGTRDHILNCQFKSKSATLRLTVGWSVSQSV